MKRTQIRKSITLMLAGILLCGSMQVMSVRATDTDTQIQSGITTEAEETLVSDPGLTEPQQIIEQDTSAQLDAQKEPVNIQDEDVPLTAGEDTSANLVKIALIGVLLVIIAFMAGYGFRVHLKQVKREE